MCTLEVMTYECTERTMYKDNARKLKLKPEWRSEPAFLQIRLAIRSGFGNDSFVNLTDEGYGTGSICIYITLSMFGHWLIC
jgi:hypothetical protein